MKRILTSCLLLMLLAFQASAQEQLSLKLQAERFFERYEYLKSVNLYLKLANRGRPDPRILERVGDCYYNMNRYPEAEPWYARAMVDTGASAVSHYHYAEVLLYSQKFEDAKQQYQIYFTKVNDPEAMKRAITNCDSAAAWVKENDTYVVKPTPNLNSAFSEWGLVTDDKGGMMFISDRRQAYDVTDNRTGNNWLRIYTTDAKGENTNQVFFSNGIDGLEIDKYHIGPIAINAKADTAYLTITTDVETKAIALDKRKNTRSQRLYTRRLQLVMAVKKYNNWAIASRFSYNNINKYSVGHAALSKNGRLLYFTSDMPGGVGKTDIWYCEKQADGSWGKPINCGQTINTKEEEAFPEIGGDGLLYYSSKGLPGMGGYDIYSSLGEKGTWTTPVNLKYPINTTADDFCLVTKDGINGYLSSNRMGGQGDDDIYQFNYAKPPAKKTSLIATATPPKITGTTRPVNAPTPVKSEDIFIIRNIYYDLDKSNIRPDAAIELNKLVDLLKAHPAFRISIASHTDSRATGEYNQALSGRRSASVIAYLTKRGISFFRLTYANFGETKLLNECADGVNCTEEQQQLNRRTEFRLVEN